MRRQRAGPVALARRHCLAAPGSAARDSGCTAERARARRGLIAQPCSLPERHKAPRVRLEAA